MEPSPALHSDYKTPGQLIDDLLTQRGWSKRVLSVVLRIDEATINKVISGKRPVDAGMAIALSEVFPDKDAEDFLELQKKYDLAKARYLVRPNEERAKLAKMFGSYPIAEMMKRGWLPTVTDVRDVEKVEPALRRFFKVEPGQEIPDFDHAAKKTGDYGDVTPTQLAWFYRVKQIAEEMIVPKYSAEALRNAIPKLKELLSSAEAARNVPKLLAECGVRFVIVESLPSAKIDGVCFWLEGSAPVIGMSLRYDRIDNFWFVLRHEIEHVLQKHGQAHMMLDAELEGAKAGTGADVAEEERIANQAAADFCVPQKSLEAFIARKAPFFAERDIIGFSRTLQIHPGLVAGQLQRKTERWDRFRNHLVKIRNHVAPSATVDGWGDVVPTEI